MNVPSAKASLSLPGMRDFFIKGNTRTLNFRLQQLKILKRSIQQNEEALMEALFLDLKKSREEAYASEIGLLITEINVAIRNLAKWMKPARVRSNLVNMPSSSRIYHDPLGVVLIISPWNYPLQLLLIPLIGAIAGGNCVILKPSELAPATSGIIERIISEIFDADYIQVVQGNGSEIVPALMNSFRFDHVFYTGSISVGKSIYKMAAEQLIPVTLELGGKSPAIVHKDANIKVAARRIVMGKFLNAGQTCIAPDYVLVEESIRGQLINTLIKTIQEFYTKSPEHSYEYAKIINEHRFDKLLSYHNQGIVLSGGKSNREKLFIEPTLLGNVQKDAPIMSEEIFGPILPILSFKTWEEAKAVVEKNPDPLAFYIFTQSRAIQKRWINFSSFGGGCINNADWQFTNHNLPFGGVGSSGIGAYHGKFSFDLFTHRKPVMKTPVWFDPKLKYPPLKGRLWLFKWLFK